MTTTPHSLIRLSAAEMAAKLRAGEITSVELTQAHLDRITEVDGQINAFLHVCAEEALASQDHRWRRIGGQGGGHLEIGKNLGAKGVKFARLGQTLTFVRAARDDRVRCDGTGWGCGKWNTGG